MKEDTTLGRDVLQMRLVAISLAVTERKDIEKVAETLPIIPESVAPKDENKAQHNTVLLHVWFGWRKALNKLRDSSRLNDVNRPC